MLQLKTYATPAEFLREQQSDLEQAETVNGMLLGLALRARQSPERGPGPVYLAAVADGDRPLLHALLIPGFRLVLSAADGASDAALELLAEDLGRGRQQVPALAAPAALAERFMTVWARASGVSGHLQMRQRLYVLETVRPPRRPVARGRLRPALTADVTLVARWSQAFSQETWGHADATHEWLRAWQRVTDGEFYLWEDGPVVSMAAWSRPTTHGVCVNGVYTPPPLRGHGYASASVAALSQQLLDQGYAFCTLYTDLANPTSNDIYQQIGYEPVCDFADYVFAEPARGEDR